MTCPNHPDVNAVAFCRECGKPLCDECRRPALGSIYCADHAPAAAAADQETPSGFTASPDFKAPPRSSYASFAASGPSASYSAPSSAAPPALDPNASPYTAPAPVRHCNTHPWVAFGLGFIPGVGAIYNGQYAKGLIHAVIFGLLISLTDHAPGPLEPLFGILIAAWVFYMAFEAYHTSIKRRRGEEAEEFSSLIDIRPAHGRFPAGAILLIVIGFILLLDTTDLINIDQLERYWPVGLIVLGIYMLYARMSDRSPGRSNAELPR